MKINAQFLLIFILILVLCACSTPVKKIPGELNLGAMIQPVPASAKFINDSLYIWGGSLVKSISDGKYHMYYSRWPRQFGMSAWVTHSEIAHAVSDSPFGPFEFRDVALPVRGAKYWDGLVTHNPHIQLFDGKYYLFYMGTTGTKASTTQYWEFRNNQQIGVAVSDHPSGPWKRKDVPLISTSNDATAHDALMVSNPSVARMPDGRFLMIYKAAAKYGSPPKGGPVVHLTATADSPTGPFKKKMQPIFTKNGEDFPAEDPYIWHDSTCFYAILKDMKGSFTGSAKSLALFYSIDGFDWKLARYPLVSSLSISWQNAERQRLHRMERPQLLIEDGQIVSLLCAAHDSKNMDYSFNIQIPVNGKKTK